MRRHDIQEAKHFRELRTKADELIELFSRAVNDT